MSLSSIFGLGKIRPSLPITPGPLAPHRESTRVNGTERDLTGVIPKSSSAAEEAAAFRSIPGMCLRDTGRLAEAVVAFRAAARLTSTTRSCRQMARSLAK